MNTHPIYRITKIKPHQLDAAKDDLNFSHFCVRNGKAQYHLLHLPDRSCGIYYALRCDVAGLTGKRAINPNEELTCYFLT